MFSYEFYDYSELIYSWRKCTSSRSFLFYPSRLFIELTDSIDDLVDYIGTSLFFKVLIKFYAILSSDSRLLT